MICSVVFAIWLYWWRPRPRSPRTYPGALPIIGHIVEAVKYRNGKNKRRKHIIIFDTSHLNTCLTFLYLIISVPTWKIHRKLLNPAFNQKVLDTFVNVMNVEAQNLVSQLKPVAGQGPINVKEFLIKYILRSVCSKYIVYNMFLADNYVQHIIAIISNYRTSLGLEAKDQDMIGKEYAQAIDEIVTIAVNRGLNVALHPSFVYNITPMRKREQELVTRIYNILNSVSMYYCKFKPILDLLLHLSDEQYGLSDDEIMAHLNTFVAPSYDTTSSALQTVLLALGSYPDVQERVYKEINEVFGNNQELTKYDLPKLVYLEAVIKEVLRIYSIAPWAKYTLRAGSTCILVLYYLHRHPSWGPDSKQFKPERWLNPDTLPTNPNVYAPFGIGKRNCIGRYRKQYAMMTLKTSVAHIVRNFKLSADISQLYWKYEVILKPIKPTLVSFTIRS
ncbi:unnamed protein product [Spodoptera littoralis]|uniref:Cytochrome n=1 Tax=Spodoptera littoralis TaxID=7109 RepID=A0A9P0I7C1_SPOLI|nr:unnamed protein product [Spodoptera littoralis]